MRGPLVAAWSYSCGVPYSRCRDAAATYRRCDLAESSRGVELLRVTATNKHLAHATREFYLAQLHHGPIPDSQA